MTPAFLILFTLDETAYSRELAPLAGHYPPSDLARLGGFMTASTAWPTILTK